MKILKSEIDWDKTINIQMTLKEFKLLKDCLLSVSYMELEKLQEKTHILMMICRKQLNSQKQY